MPDSPQDPKSTPTKNAPEIKDPSESDGGLVLGKVSDGAKKIDNTHLEFEVDEETAKEISGADSDESDGASVTDINQYREQKKNNQEPLSPNEQLGAANDLGHRDQPNATSSTNDDLQKPLTPEEQPDAAVDLSKYRDKKNKNDQYGRTPPTKIAAENPNAFHKQDNPSLVPDETLDKTTEPITKPTTEETEPENTEPEPNNEPQSLAAEDQASAAAQMQNESAQIQNIQNQARLRQGEAAVGTKEQSEDAAKKMAKQMAAKGLLAIPILGEILAVFGAISMIPIIGPTVGAFLFIQTIIAIVFSLFLFFLPFINTLIGFIIALPLSFVAYSIFGEKTKETLSYLSPIPQKTESGKLIQMRNKSASTANRPPVSNDQNFQKAA